jgi:DNA-binding transcriptional regulator YdaS (Cro superfamily)
VPTFRIVSLAPWQYVLYAYGMNTFETWVKDSGGAGEVAKLLGVSPDAVRKWMRGDRRPRPEMAAAIERVSGGAVQRASLIWNEAA